jgi:hypothetical protein
VLEYFKQNCKKIDSTEPASSREETGFSASQEIYRILWQSNVHYRY